ncbi:hypothetical protein B0A49_06631 [Cryomyces minteri]|uniref:Uncharacterized protein n=1 Tax=Cryomyces minteri TaxID=331657 RepID=A0A4U0XGZ3_9PEZI|nr:hypothetical protein B0A49_06631 [Cryomyces minteri]
MALYSPTSPPDHSARHRSMTSATSISLPDELYTHRPNMQRAKPVGRNGLPLNEPSPWQPYLDVPPPYQIARFYAQTVHEQTSERETCIRAARFLTYNEFESGSESESFSLSCASTLSRLRAVERRWAAGLPASDLETAFWNACYERHHYPARFGRRDAYLCDTVDVEIARQTRTAEIEGGSISLVDALTRMSLAAGRRAESLAAQLRCLSVRSEDDGDDDDDNGLEEAFREAFAQAEREERKIAVAQRL